MPSPFPFAKLFQPAVIGEAAETHFQRVAADRLRRMSGRTNPGRASFLLTPAVFQCYDYERRSFHEG